MYILSVFLRTVSKNTKYWFANVCFFFSFFIYNYNKTVIYREMMPGAMTPLTISFFMQSMEHAGQVSSLFIIQHAGQVSSLFIIQHVWQIISFLSFNMLV